MDSLYNNGNHKDELIRESGRFANPYFAEFDMNIDVGSLGASTSQIPIPNFNRYKIIQLKAVNTNPGGNTTLDLTGMVEPFDEETGARIKFAEKIIENTGTDFIRIRHLNGGSDATQQFYNRNLGVIDLYPGQAIVYRYDSDPLSPSYEKWVSTQIYKTVIGNETKIATGGMYWDGNTTSFTLSTPDGYKKIQGGTATGINLNRFSYANNRLTYTGTSPILVDIDMHLSAYYISGGAFLANVGITKNGSNIGNTPIEGSINGFSVYSAREPVSTGIKGITLNTNDYIEGNIAKLSGTPQDIVIVNYNLNITEV